MVFLVLYHNRIKGFISDTEFRHRSHFSVVDTLTTPSRINTTLHEVSKIETYLNHLPIYFCLREKKGALEVIINSEVIF